MSHSRRPAVYLLKKNDSFIEFNDVATNLVGNWLWEAQRMERERRQVKLRLEILKRLYPQKPRLIKAKDKQSYLDSLACKINARQRAQSERNIERRFCEARARWIQRRQRSSAQ